MMDTLTSGCLELEVWFLECVFYQIKSKPLLDESEQIFYINVSFVPICLQSAIYRAQASCTVTLLPPPLPRVHFLSLVWRWRYLFWLSELETPTGDMFTSAEAASHCDWLHSVYVYIKRLMYSRFRPHFIDINLKVNAFHQIFTV